VKEVNALVKEAWKDVSKEIKDKLQANYLAAKEKYDDDMKEYKARTSVSTESEAQDEPVRMIPPPIKSKPQKRKLEK
jgi:hypothetical protein